jgi:hypothetical protein
MEGNDMGATNIMTRFFGVMSVTTLAASLGWIGCGSNNKQVATPEAGDAKKTELSSSSGDNPCKSKENCPPVAAQPNANFAPSGALLGYVGEPVNWTFTGIDTKSMAPDQASSTRRVMVLLDRIPSEAQFVPGKNEPLSVKVKIEWTPQKVYAGKQLDIILRDMDRCVMDLGEDECNEYSLKEKYDTKETVPWEIADKDALQAQRAEAYRRVTS